MAFKFVPSFLAISSPPGRNTDRQSPEHPSTEVCVANCETPRRLEIQEVKYTHITEVGMKPSTWAFRGANPAKAGTVVSVGLNRSSKFA